MISKISRILQIICLSVICFVSVSVHAQAPDTPDGDTTVTTTTTRTVTSTTSYRIVETSETSRETSFDESDDPAGLPTVAETYAASANSIGSDPVTTPSGLGKVTDFGAPWQAEIYSPEPLGNYSDEVRAQLEDWELPHRCGGSLIAPDWVLTAAHCINDAKVRELHYRVRLGATDISQGDGVTYAIDRIVRHAKYNKPNHIFSDDIALVHLVNEGQPRDPRRVQAIRLMQTPVDAPLPDGAVVTATGWGKTKAEGQHPAAVLMAVDLRIMPQADCAALPNHGSKINPNVLCAAAPGKGTCQGDSGGPLVLTYSDEPVLVGIVSWSRGKCSGNGLPTMFTRVSNYADWVQRAMATDPSVGKLE